MELSRGAVALGMFFAESHSCWHEYLAQALDWTIGSLMEETTERWMQPISMKPRR